MSRDVFALSSIMCIRILFFIAYTWESCIEGHVLFEIQNVLIEKIKMADFCWSECDARLFCLVSTSQAELHQSCLMNDEKKLNKTSP